MLSPQKLLRVQRLSELFPERDAEHLGLDDAQQTKFAKLYVEYRTDMPKFWKAVSDAFDPVIAIDFKWRGSWAFSPLTTLH